MRIPSSTSYPLTNQESVQKDSNGIDRGNLRNKGKLKEKGIITCHSINRISIKQMEEFL
jgi:hypothetical protein